MRKLAVIRSNSDDTCPFGLSIPTGCKLAGGNIDRMFPLEKLGSQATPEEKQKIAAANTRLLTMVVMGGGETPAECRYAANLFPEKEAVDCDHGDTAAGESSKGSLLGSPFYSHVFSGVGLDGLYSYPLGFYADSNISRNLFYGIYSLQGGYSKEELVKLAIKALYDSIDERLHSNKNV